MTRALILFFSSLAGCLLQTELAGELRIFGVAPDFMIVILVLMSDDYGPFGGFTAGALMGLFYDATVGQSPAIFLVAYPIIGLAACYFRTGLDKRLTKLRHKRLFELILICFLLTLAREILYIGYLFLIGAEQSFVTLFRMMVAAVYTSIWMIPFTGIKDFVLWQRRQRAEAAAEAKALEDARKKTEAPKNARGKAERPENARSEAESSESIRDKTEAPENTRDDAESPEYAREKAKAHENTIDDANTPEELQEKAETPENTRGNANTPEDILGKAKASENTRGNANTPEDIQGKAEAPVNAGKKDTLPEHTRRRAETRENARKEEEGKT